MYKFGIEKDVRYKTIKVKCFEREKERKGRRKEWKVWFKECELCEVRTKKKSQKEKKWQNRKSKVLWNKKKGKGKVTQSESKDWLKECE